MKVLIDIEANGLVNPTEIWLIVCKNTETGEFNIFREVTTDAAEKERFLEFAERVSVWIGHNFLGYDYPVLCNLIGFRPIDVATECLDTLIVSKLVDYPRQGHSIEHYGEEFGIEKGTFSKWNAPELLQVSSDLFKELETYCIRDVEICHKIYLKYLKYTSKEEHKPSIELEHKFQLIVNDLSNNGFSFNTKKAQVLLNKVKEELDVLDKEILKEFPPKEVLIRKFVPKATKFGTISRTSVPRSLHENIASYEIGKVYRHTKQVAFNPSSHKQVVQVLNEAGWSPIDKTQTHIETEREINRHKYQRKGTNGVDLSSLYDKLKILEKSGWKISENNLSSLPEVDDLELWKNKCRIKILKTPELTQESTLGKILINSKLKLEDIIKNTQIKSVPQPSCITIKIQDVLKTGNSNEITAFLLKTLKECLPNKTDVAEFVKNENNLWSIIVTPQDVFVDCSASFVTDTWAGMRDLTSLQKNISKLNAARTLAQRILLESRRRTLTEWLGLVTSDGRIHGKFYGLGAWTHRMAHQHPNTANIPTDAKLYGSEMRALWQAPKNRLLVGVDAEGIQLRIFAHYIDDPEFTEALVKGKKDEHTDPHSLNQRILGAKSRNIAKRFIFAYLLGAGVGKLAQLLEISENEARRALDRLLERYKGLALLKDTIIPVDARRGWFTGLDGRRVAIPGDSVGERKHLCMSGYLQNGEAIVMKKACLHWYAELHKAELEFDRLRWLLVNFVHDEWQTEVNNNMELALLVAKTQADSLQTVGEELKLKCPLAGSYWNDDRKDYTIGTNWLTTH